LDSATEQKKTTLAQRGFWKSRNAGLLWYRLLLSKQKLKNYSEFKFRKNLSPI
jgi:hypothetical protein